MKPWILQQVRSRGEVAISDAFPSKMWHGRHESQRTAQAFEGGYYPLFQGYPLFLVSYYGASIQDVRIRGEGSWKCGRSKEGCVTIIALIRSKCGQGRRGQKIWKFWGRHIWREREREREGKMYRQCFKAIPSFPYFWVKVIRRPVTN